MDDKGQSALEVVGIIAIIVVLVIGVFVAAIGCKYIGGTSAVISKETNPQQVYKDYQWFIKQCNSIDSMRADIEFANNNIKGLEAPYRYDNGTLMPRSEWAETDLRNYNLRVNERNGMVYKHNQLVKTYNDNMDNILKKWKNVGEYPSNDDWASLPKAYDDYIVEVAT